jgi:hypothetical protein
MDKDCNALGEGVRDIFENIWLLQGLNVPFIRLVTFFSFFNCNTLVQYRHTLLKPCGIVLNCLSRAVRQF